MHIAYIEGLSRGSLLSIGIGLLMITQPVQCRTAGPVGRVYNAAIHAPSHLVRYSSSSFDLTFSLDEGGGRKATRQLDVKLELSPSDGIFSAGAAFEYISSNGSVRHELVDRSEYRSFTGGAFVKKSTSTQWVRSGWAWVALERDGDSPLFEGTFQLHGADRHIHLEPNLKTVRAGRHPRIEELPHNATMLSYSWDSPGEIVSGIEMMYDIVGKSPSSDLEDEASLEHRVGSPGEQGCRSAPAVSAPGSTAGCPQERTAIQMGVATDCSYMGRFPSLSSMKAHVIRQVSMASQLYERSFNVSLQILKFVVGTCEGGPSWDVPCGELGMIDARLQRFSRWKAGFEDDTGLWTLLSNCSEVDGGGSARNAVGLAYIGGLCEPSRGGDALAVNVVAYPEAAEWLVMAHEIGHSFGAEHDCAVDCLPSSRETCCGALRKGTCDLGYIMNPGLTGAMRFSPCSVTQICSSLGRKRAREGCVVPKNCTANNCNDWGRGGERDERDSPKNWIKMGRAIVFLVGFLVGGPAVAMVIYGALSLYRKRERR